MLGSNYKKRTIPSIPCLEKEMKPIGPWSYTPKHNLVSQSVKNSVDMGRKNTDTLYGLEGSKLYTPIVN